MPAAAMRNTAQSRRNAIMMLAICASISHPIDALSIKTNGGYENNDAKNIATTKPERIKVCTSSTCSRNGSEMLLDALQLLAATDVTITKDYCLGACTRDGVVIKASSKQRRQVLPCGVLETEAMAIETAMEILSAANNNKSAEDSGGGTSSSPLLDEGKLKEVQAKLASKEQVLVNSVAPAVCKNCGVALQLYRGNCAKCGKYPY